MRNNDGGDLVVGVKKNGQLNIEDAPDDVERIFNVDAIQGLITNHSSESFEIAISFHKKKNKEFVGISVPPGVKTPVAIRKPLIDENRKVIIKKDTVYVRSLDSNNTPSTTKATYKDWHRIVEKCFDNREADIGRFLRRHLANIPNIKDLFGFFLKEKQKTNETIENRATDFLNSSLARYNQEVSKRQIKLPSHGAMEVAAVINGETASFSTNRDFLNLLLSNNPDYTGWPLWVDSRSFSDASERPYVFKGFWESLVANFERGWHHLDFWRISPNGYFYLRQGLQDDIHGSKVKYTHMKTLDFGLTVLRVAEAIAVGIAFAKTMECDEEKSVFFVFRWTNLEGRSLSSWADPKRHLSSELKSQQNEVISYIEVPVNVPKSALYSYVHEVTKSIFEIFDGFQLSEKVTEELVTALLERKL